MAAIDIPNAKDRFKLLFAAPFRPLRARKELEALLNRTPQEIANFLGKSQLPDDACAKICELWGIDLKDLVARGDDVFLAALARVGPAGHWDRIIRSLATRDGEAISIRRVVRSAGDESEWVPAPAARLAAHPKFPIPDGPPVVLRRGDFFYIEINCDHVSTEARFDSRIDIVAVLEADQNWMQCLWPSNLSNQPPGGRIRIPHFDGGSIREYPLKQETSGQQEYYVILWPTKTAKPNPLSKALEGMGFSGPQPRGRLDELAKLLVESASGDWRILYKRIVVAEAFATGPQVSSSAPADA